MESDSLQYAASPGQGDVISTDARKNLFHESDGDRANENFEITHSSRPKMSYESQTSTPIEDWEDLMNWVDPRNAAEPKMDCESSDSESNNKDLAELPSSHNVFGTSVPSAGFFTPSSAQLRNASYTRNSMRSAISSFGTRQSFATAQSSLASYVTASDSPRRGWVGLTPPADEVNLGSITTLRPSSHVIARQELRNLVDAIEERLLRRTIFPFGRPQEDTFLRKGCILSTLHSCLHQGSPVTSLEPTIEDVTNDIKNLVCELSADVIKLDVAVEVYKFALDRGHLKHLVPSGMFTDGHMSTSEWLMHLHSRGILPDEAQALDWSGRGQHAEYSPLEESLIPLVEGKVLGYSMSAVVQRVQCRRIQLARKTVQCNRKFTKEMAITEVEHLQRAQHRHVVRVVGTYTLKKKLAILLYPAAEWNLDEFLDEMCDEGPPTLQFADELRTFFGCLTNAILFIHNCSIKHMDIKPKNILVHIVRGCYQVFIADFGIARAYASAEESNTDSPTSFTPIYATPEVVAQSLRGFPADIFSLGCVFLEILAVLSSTQHFNYRVILAEVRQNKSYEANLYLIRSWFNIHTCAFSGALRGRWGHRNEMKIEELVLTFRRMLDSNPDSRPTARSLWGSVRHFSCGDCGDGPEPFVAAKEESIDVDIHYKEARSLGRTTDRNTYKTPSTTCAATTAQDSKET